MDSSHRINSISVTPTVGRQTPRDDFGAMLAHSASQAVRIGGLLATGVTSGNPVLSAAVSGVASIARATQAVVGPVGAAVPQAAANLPEGRGEAFELLQLQDQQSKQYLALQAQMQRESREYNAVSNVMKVRHDSAKAAINNIR